MVANYVNAGGRFFWTVLPSLQFSLKLVYFYTVTVGQSEITLLVLCRGAPTGVETMKNVISFELQSGWFYFPDLVTC